MAGMKKAASVLAALVAAAVVLPAAASAQEVQLGVTTSPLISPTCPAGATSTQCTILLTEVTAYATLRDGVKSPLQVTQSGVISSFSVGLTSRTTITSAVLKSQDSKYGGSPEVQLTVLRPVGTTANPAYRVVAQSAVFNVLNQLGQVAEFPLVMPLPVVRGEVVALTVPTWAPVLSIELDTSKFSYSQSRAKSTTTSGTSSTSSCNATAKVDLSQITIGALSNYTCNYPGSRIEYSALEIVTPKGFSSLVRRREPVATKQH